MANYCSAVTSGSSVLGSSPSWGHFVMPLSI